MKQASWCLNYYRMFIEYFISCCHNFYLGGQQYPVHDDVIKWKHFPRYWPFVWGIHRPLVYSPHNGQWCWALMFSLICAWINGWLNHEAGDLRCHHTHYDVIVMILCSRANNTSLMANVLVAVNCGVILIIWNPWMIQNLKHVEMQIMCEILKSKCTTGQCWCLSLLGNLGEMVSLTKLWYPLKAANMLCPFVGVGGDWLLWIHPYKWAFMKV